VLDILESARPHVVVFSFIDPLKRVEDVGRSYIRYL
jgi:hypothetical protein